MKKHIGELIVGLILVFAGALASYYIFRPSPLAFASCQPLKGNAELEVTCDNQSNYHNHIVWDFGEKNKSKIKDEDRVIYSYKAPGEYVVKLTAYGQGSPDEWYQLISVKESRDLKSALDIKVLGLTKENRIIKNKTLQISKTKDDHPSTLSDHSRDYREVFSADPGFKIVDASFKQTSSARANDIRYNISPNGKNVEFSYKLTSGPAVDQYRGWLRGDLVVKQEQIKPAETVSLASNISVAKVGTYPLEVSASLADLKGITISDSSGRLLAAGEPSGILMSNLENLEFSFLEEGGQTFLKVEYRE